MLRCVAEKSSFVWHSSTGTAVADLDESFEAAKKHAGWKIAASIARQSWGVRDFRVYSPEGCYLRFAEGPTLGSGARAD